jgi:hypothetical protein
MVVSLWHIDATAQQTYLKWSTVQVTVKYAVHERNV